MIKKIFLISLTLIFVAYIEVYAGFTGPTEVLSTTYGNGNGQVGLRQGDSGDEFPWRMAVSPTSRVALCDEANDRVAIFKSDGTFERNIDILSTGVVFDSSDSLYLKAKFRKFDKDGTETFVKDVGYHDIFTADGNIIGYDRDKKTYHIYSPTGQLIKTSAERPLELGVVQEKSLGGGRYQVTIQYPDATYGFTGSYGVYVRDNRGRINAIEGGSVTKINECGKTIGQVKIPDTVYGPPQVIGREKIPVYLAQYGKPVVAPNGDVYTWKRTPDKYSILKWTWVDDPNVPTGPEPPSGLAVTPSINGLYLTWKASPNDPGCVTKNEIARATTSGGLFSTIDSVDKGVLKYNDTTAEVGTTYYYKVRAMAGSDPSAYTSEVSGKR